MVCEQFSCGTSVIHRLNSRIRILAATTFAVVVVSADRVDVLAAALVLASICAAAARLPARPLLRRLATLNIFMAVICATLSTTIPGREILCMGPLSVSREGLMRALLITLRANAVVLTLTALAATMNTAQLGHALNRLGLPARLCHLFLFTVRYIDVLRHEYARLTAAMKVRGFRGGFSTHAMRCYGHLTGMLLVRGFDRSQRILAAMKCRGFRGRFYVLDTSRFARRDYLFAMVASVAIVLLAMREWI